MPFCAPCLRPADSSVLTYTKHSTQSLLKKSKTRRFKRIKGSNIIQEVIPSNQTIDLISNYDMTVFHDDELDDTQVALSHRRSKKIPQSQLQLEIINQIYYNNQKPEEIFGSIELDLAHQMVNSIDLWNTELPFLHSYENLPPNFV